MPSRVELMAIYFGDNPIAQLNPPAKPLQLPNPVSQDLLRSMRADLLKMPAGFRRTIRATGLPPLGLE